MADPVTALMTIGGAAISAMGSMHQANASADAALFEANRSYENAWMVEERADEEERRSRVESKKTLGSIRAAYGASGVTMDGSARDYLEDNAAIAETNALSIRHQGAIEAKAFRDEAFQLRRQAKSYREAGIFSAAGAGISGFASVLRRK